MSCHKLGRLDDDAVRRWPSRCGFSVLARRLHVCSSYGVVAVHCLLLSACSHKNALRQGLAVVKHGFNGGSSTVERAPLLAFCELPLDVQGFEEVEAKLVLPRTSLTIKRPQDSSPAGSRPLYCRYWKTIGRPYVHLLTVAALVWRQLPSSLQNKGEKNWELLVKLQHAPILPPHFEKFVEMVTRIS